MKKIELDNINYFRSKVVYGKAELEKAIKAKSRKHSENAIKKAEEEIVRLEQWHTDNETELAKYEAEAEEAKKLIAVGGEIVLACAWLDDYGRRESGVNRSRYDSLEEAEEAYRKIKDDNGGYVEMWIEVDEVGRLKRIKALQAEIEKLQAELKGLSGDD